MEKIDQHDYYRDRLLKATDFIQSNFCNKNVLKHIAKNQYMNQAYISHLMKEKIDYNYRQLINFYRVGYAIRLLLQTNFNISEISVECGFSATRYFYKEFKKFHADGPTAFRKKYRDCIPVVERKDTLSVFEQYRKSSDTLSEQNAYHITKCMDEKKYRNSLLIKRDTENCSVWDVRNENGEIVGKAYIIEDR